MTQTSSLTGPDRPADRRLRKGARIAALRDHASFVVACLMLALIVVLYGSLQAGIFSQDEINLDTTAAMTLILAATGQTIVLLRGGIDLSIGGMISLGTCIAATRFGEGALSVAGWSAFILMLGFDVGAVNGLLISVPRLQPFVATLATWSILGGVAMIVLPSDGGAVPGWWLDLGYKSVLGFTSPVWLMVALLIWWRWFISTPRGVAIKATGSSERSAFLSGVSILRINLVTYGLSGLFAAIASLYLTTQTGAGSPTIGNDYILTSIAAAVIGGVSMTGGKGGLSGMLIGAFILTLIGNLVFALHVSSYWQPVASGAILLVSVLATGLVDPAAGGKAR